MPFPEHLVYYTNSTGWFWGLSSRSRTVPEDPIREYWCIGLLVYWCIGV